MNGAPGTSIENNSSYSALFAQFDDSGSVASSQKNNVYINSGTNDYEGRLEQTFSDIGTLSDDASVDVNSTREDPLYRDREGKDLRLQTIETGFFHDSPAKEAGDDGEDMGAFAIHYPDAVETITLLNFGKTDPAGNYRNPDVVEPRFYGTKLAEGENEDGGAFSRRSAVKREFVLIWRDKNDMPEAQRQDLEDFFKNENRDLELSLDGGVTQIPVKLMMTDDFRFQEITETYVDDSVPRPVERIILKER